MFHPGLDRDTNPRLRDAAPFERRFYPLVQAKRSSRKELGLKALALAVSWGCIGLTGRWLFPEDGAAQQGYLLGWVVLALGRELPRALLLRKMGLPWQMSWWIPAPPPLGCLGSWFQLASPPRTRSDLVDVGLAGVWGLLGASLGLIGAVEWLGPGFPAAWTWPVGESFGASLNGLSGIWHGLTQAAWVGTFLAFFHSLPIGTWDGGLMASGILGRKASHVRKPAAGLLALFCLWTLQPGWILPGILLLLPWWPSPALAFNPFVEAGRWRKGLVLLTWTVGLALAGPFPLPFWQLAP